MLALLRMAIVCLQNGVNVVNIAVMPDVPSQQTTIHDNKIQHHTTEPPPTATVEPKHQH
jgi:hypothetical protein